MIIVYFNNMTFASHSRTPKSAAYFLYTIPQTPDYVGKDKYDAKSGAMLALLKYGSGVPLYRLNKLQTSLGMPLPPSTKWEIIERVANKIHPVYTKLIHQAGH